MEERGKKVLSFVLLSILFVSVIVMSMGLVSAADPGLGPIAGSFKSLFTDWSEGAVGNNVAKIIFFIMISLLIYLIFDGILGKTNKGIILIISILVGFLSTAYIAPDEVFSLLNSYTALGLTLITLVPLLILGGLTYRAATADEGKVPLIMMQYFAWILFAIYSGYRFIYDWAWGKEGSGFMNGILLATAGAAVVVVVLNRKIIGFISKKEQEVEQQVVSEKLDNLATMVNQIDKTTKKMAKGTKK